MKKIEHHKFSLILLEECIDWENDIFRNCFKYLKTFDSLEEIKKEQQEFLHKTIIIPTY